MEQSTRHFPSHNALASLSQHPPQMVGHVNDEEVEEDDVHPLVEVIFQQPLVLLCQAFEAAEAQNQLIRTL